MNLSFFKGMTGFQADYGDSCVCVCVFEEHGHVRVRKKVSLAVSAGVQRSECEALNY